MKYRWTDEHRANMALAQRGKHHTEETKERLRQIRAQQIFTPETRRKHSLTAKRLGIRPPVYYGSNHPRWRGGLSRDRHNHDSRYRQWREAVFVRDGYQCVFCGAHSRQGQHLRLEGDHIAPWALYPELRYDVNNGRTLCVACHEQTPTYKGRTRKKMGVGL